MIIIVNDNDQSIAENHGGLYKGLKELRDTNGESPDNIFKAMGLEYYYLGDGHDVSALIKIIYVCQRYRPCSSIAYPYDQR